MIDWLGNQIILNELNLRTFIIDYRHVSQIDPGSADVLVVMSQYKLGNMLQMWYPTKLTEQNKENLMEWLVGTN